MIVLRNCQEMSVPEVWLRIIYSATTIWGGFRRARPQAVPQRTSIISGRIIDRPTQPASLFSSHVLSSESVNQPILKSIQLFLLTAAQFEAKLRNETKEGRKKTILTHQIHHSHNKIRLVTQKSSIIKNIKRSTHKRRKISFRLLKEQTRGNRLAIG